MTQTEARKIFLDKYDQFAVDLADRFIVELRDQGHVATGKLLRSVVAKVTDTLNKIEVGLSHLDYGIAVNTGTPAAQVPRTIKFIMDLKAWIRVKRIANGVDKEVENIAVLMAKRMWKKGIPLPGSYRFTRNQRRTGWIDYIFEKYNVQWTEQVSDMSQEYIDHSFDAMLEKTIKPYQPYLTFK